MKMKKVLISTSSFGKGDNRPLDYIKSKAEIILNPYGRQLTTEEFIKLIEGCDGVIAGTEKITKEALISAPKLKVISRCGAGTDNVDISAARDIGIAVWNTPDAPMVAVAELTIALILDVSRKVSLMDKEVKNGVWNKRVGSLISGKKVGIIGMGRIGKRVAGLLLAFGTEIKYFDIEPKEVEYQRETDMGNLLRWADIVTLHCSISNNNTSLMGKNEMAFMKSSAIIINTSRGKLIDEDALYDALVNERIRGAGLDVYNKEPYTGRLVQLENVVLTPHIASSTRESRFDMEMQAAENLVKELALDD